MAQIHPLNGHMDKNEQAQKKAPTSAGSRVARVHPGVRRWKYRAVVEQYDPLTSDWKSELDMNLGCMTCLTLTSMMCDHASR